MWFNQIYFGLMNLSPFSLCSCRWRSLFLSGSENGHASSLFAPASSKAFFLVRSRCLACLVILTCCFHLGPTELYKCNAASETEVAHTPSLPVTGLKLSLCLETDRKTSLPSSGTLTMRASRRISLRISSLPQKAQPCHDACQKQCIVQVRSISAWNHIIMEWCRHSVWSHWPRTQQHQTWSSVAPPQSSWLSHNRMIPVQWTKRERARRVREETHELHERDEEGFPSSCEKVTCAQIELQ